MLLQRDGQTDIQQNCLGQESRDWSDVIYKLWSSKNRWRRSWTRFFLSAPQKEPFLPTPLGCSPQKSENVVLFQSLKRAVPMRVPVPQCLGMGNVGRQVICLLTSVTYYHHKINMIYLSKSLKGIKGLALKSCFQSNCTASVRLWPSISSFKTEVSPRHTHTHSLQGFQTQPRPVNLSPNLGFTIFSYIIIGKWLTSSNIMPLSLIQLRKTVFFYGCGVILQNKHLSQRRLGWEAL